MLHVKLCRLAVDLKCIVWDLRDPKQTRRLDSAVEVVQLHTEARTGLEEVNSNENECADMMRAIRGNIFALKHPHVVRHIIKISIVVPRGVCAGGIGESRETLVVVNHSRLCIQVRRPKQVNHRWKINPSRDGHGLRQNRKMPFVRDEPSCRSYGSDISSAVVKACPARTKRARVPMASGKSSSNFSKRLLRRIDA